MADLKLTLACWDYDRTRPLIEGRVKPRGIDLEVLVLRPRQMFPRMLENREFHASELSLASYASLIGRGECPFVAIPVAVSKFFRHGCMYVRKGAGIKHPRDLVGKRVGTTQYSSTAVTFMRGMLKDEYGIDAKDMHWFMGGLTKPTETPLIPLDLPSDIRLDFVPEGDTLERMMVEGAWMRCCPFISPSCSRMAGRGSSACSRTSRKSRRTITSARAFSDHAHDCAARRCRARASMGAPEPV